MVARRRAAIDRDGGTLDVARALGAQEQRQRRNVLGLAEPAHVALGQRLGAQLVDRPAQGRRALPAGRNENPLPIMPLPEGNLSMSTLIDEVRRALRAGLSATSNA